jgi:SDR family mycofactocin-dependent oxidoreductase
MGKVDGKVAFITGAARGQGRSHALKLAAEGADIIGIDLCADIATNPYPLGSRAELDETVELVEKLDRRMIASVADVRDYRAVKSAVDAGVAELGRLDIVCANAGIAPMSFGRIEEDEELQQWTDVLQVNLFGVFHACRAAIPHIIAGGRGGSIIMTSSTAGLRGFGGWTGGGVGYGAAKHGVVGLMRSMANGLAEHSIRVNTVHPTAVRTMMATNDAITSWVAGDPTRGAHMANALPVDMVEPEDISNAVLFLACDDGRYVTGTTLPVDAGFCNKI